MCLFLINKDGIEGSASCFEHYKFFLEQLAISKISKLNMQPYLTFWDQKIYLYGQVMLFIAEDNTVNFTVGTLS